MQCISTEIPETVCRVGAEVLWEPTQGSGSQQKAWLQVQEITVSRDLNEPQWQQLQ